MKEIFEVNDFAEGLSRLDALIGQEQSFDFHRPITMIASGGFVSLICLRNRTSTHDLDYFLSPTEFGDDQIKVTAALKRAIDTVSEDLKYHEKWCNDDMALFLTLLADPAALFERSLQQNEVLYIGQNLVVYAVLWEWVFIRKLKRLQMELQMPRMEDWLDCTAILRVLATRSPDPLDRSMLTQFDDTEREPPVYDETVDSINVAHRQKFGVDAFTQASNTQSAD